jgi:hypothetical protein
MASELTPAAWLLLTSVRSSVRLPQLSMPPPPAKAKGQGPPGHGGPTGTVALGPTRLPLMTLSVTFTVAPGTM